MAPRRSVRAKGSAYKKGDYVEYQSKGQTVAGQLLKKAPNGAGWIVSPTDRRRKTEEVPEKDLGAIVDAADALSTRALKAKNKGGGGRSNNRESSQTSSNSDGSLDEPQAGSGKRGRGGSARGSSSEDGASSSGRKRKSDESGNSGSDRKSRKTVTFSQEESGNASSSNRKKGKKGSGKKTAKATARIGTRSTRGAGEAPVMLPELPARRKNLFKKKKIKKDENVTVVKMLTGTLYLYRGDRPRAEFVRSK